MVHPWSRTYTRLEKSFGAQIQPAAQDKNDPRFVSYWRRMPVSAVSEGKVEDVEPLLEDKAIDVKGLSPGGETPLCIATHGQDIEMVRVLLQSKDTDVNLPRGTGQDTPLCIAASKGTAEIVDLLLHHESAQLGPSNSHGTEQALFWAASHGHNETFQRVWNYPGISVDVNHPVDMNWQCGYGHGLVTLLGAAAAQVKGLDIVKLILDGAHGEVDLNGVSWALTTDGHVMKRTPPKIAASNGRKDIVRYLLGFQRKIRLKAGAPKVTPLWQAVRMNHIDMVELLISSGADITAGRKRLNAPRTPLEEALSQGLNEMVELLHRYGT